MTARLAQVATDRIKEAGLHIPVALHLDHGMTYEQCVMAIEGDFSSVMIDGSKLPFEENIALTQKSSGVCTCTSCYRGGRAWHIKGKGGRRNRRYR